MEGKITIDKPGELTATIVLSARVCEWEELSRQLKAAWPSSSLSLIISELMQKLNSSIWAEKK